MTGGSPLAANGLIYQASGDGKLRGIDQGTGSQLWERALPDLIDSSPAIDSQNQLYLGTYHGLVLSLDLTPKKWRHENREFA